MKLKKILSISLSGLLFANSFVVTPRADNVTPHPSPVTPAMPESNRNTSSNHAARVAAYCAGPSVGAAGIIGLFSYLIYKRANTVPADYLYKKILGSEENNVTADDWFYRLGGTPQDINNYQNLVTYFNSGKIQSPIYLGVRGSEDTFVTIDNDTQRYPRECFGEVYNSGSNNFLEPFKRILKIYYGTHQGVRYTQGWDYVLYMIYRKFMVTNQPLDGNNEAKVYFIYTKFMKMLKDKFDKSESWGTQGTEYFQSYVCTAPNKQYQSENIRKMSNDPVVSKSNCFMRGVLTAGSYIFISQHKKADEILRIWDKIIMDDQFISGPNKDFNADAVLNNLNYVIYSNLASNKLSYEA